MKRVVLALAGLALTCLAATYLVDWGGSSDPAERESPSAEDQAVTPSPPPGKGPATAGRHCLDPAFLQTHLGPEFAGMSAADLVDEPGAMMRPFSLSTGRSVEVALRELVSHEALKREVRSLTSGMTLRLSGSRVGAHAGVLPATSLSSWAPFPDGVSLVGLGTDVGSELRVHPPFSWRTGDLRGFALRRGRFRFEYITPLFVEGGTCSVLIDHCYISVSGISRTAPGRLDLLGGRGPSLLYARNSTFDLSGISGNEQPFKAEDLEALPEDMRFPDLIDELNAEWSGGPSLLRGEGTLVARFEDCTLVGRPRTVAEGRLPNSAVVFVRCKFMGGDGESVAMSCRGFVRFEDCEFSGVRVTRVGEDN